MKLWNALAPHSRSSRVLVLAAGTGVLTGLVVAAFATLAEEVLFEALLERPLGWQVLAPTAGLALSALLLATVGRGTSNATSDEYVRAFHERHPRLPLLELPAKLAAGVATIASGGALGLEGPATYAGANVGNNVQRAVHRLFTREEAQVLMTAGAAAGVAAVFKTPATGVVFALEVPYRDDVASRALLPALVASAAGYLTYVSLVGTEPVVAALGRRPVLDTPTLAGAVVVGLGAGLFGRAFARLIHGASWLASHVALVWRVAGAGAVLAGLAIWSDRVYGAPLALGPGYNAIEWASAPDHSAALVALLLVARLVATSGTVAASGTGGLFIPLATSGVLLGRLVAVAFGDPKSGLYPTIGLAAVLGVAHRTPLAAVTFVAETSQGEAYVIPALLAAAISQVVAGRSSVLTHQRERRQGLIERRVSLPITSALDTEVLTVPPDATIAEFLFVHVLGRRERTVPVVDGGRYLGLCELDALSSVDRDRWEETTVAEVMRTDVPVARTSWTLRDVVAALERASVDRLAVCDARDDFIGVVTDADIVALDEILDETGG